MARHACRTVNVEFKPGDLAHHLEGALALGLLEVVAAHGLRGDVIGEIVPAHRLGAAPPEAEDRLAVDIGPCECHIGAGGDAARRVLAGERERDHAAHRGAVHEHAVEPDGVEQRGAVVGPALDRVALARHVRSPVSTGVEREQAEVLAKAVVDEPEVLTPEQRTAELQDDGLVLGAGELVVEADPVGERGVGHRCDLRIG